MIVLFVPERAFLLSHSQFNSLFCVVSVRRQVIKMLVLIVAIFMLCWGPRLLMNLFLIFGPIAYNSTTYNIRVVCNILSFVHSALNPFVYGFMSSKFRSMVCASFRCRKAGKARGGGDERLVSQASFIRPHSQVSTVDTTIHKIQKSIRLKPNSRRASLQNRSPLFGKSSVAPAGNSNYRRPTTVSMVGGNAIEMRHMDKY